jgi:hypothetical protein
VKEFELQEHICSLELNLLTDEVRSSAKRLSELLSDDFMEYGSSGRVWQRSDYSGSNGIGKVTIRISDFKIQRLAETVVLATYQALNVERMLKVRPEHYAALYGFTKIIDGR